MNVKMLFLSVAALAATVVAAPAEASAAPGYVCETHFKHQSLYGQHGMVYVSVYTEPACSGSWVVGAIFCTTGGTANQCSQPDLNTAPEIQALMQNLQHAAASRQKINVVWSGNGAGKWVTFYGN